MIDIVFVAGLAAVMSAALAWGVRTLPSERWQMIAAVPLTKNGSGEWRGLNLTYYGFFSATASVFGVALVVILATSVNIPLAALAAVIVIMLGICVPASRLIAWVVEGKRNTFTIAGAAFLGSLMLPPGLVAARWMLGKSMGWNIAVVPLLAAAAIAYAFSEAVGRMACLSFGCCYGKPVREVGPRLSKFFGHFPAIFHGETKKVAYASGLAEEPLVPVQAITAVLFTASGLIGLVLFLAGYFRLAAIIPALATWGWRALSELLRADYRGDSRISAYQVMAIIAMVYLSIVLLLLPAGGPPPNLAAGLAVVTSAGVIVALEVLWVALFLYYGRSRVTGSVLSFHVVAEHV